MMSHQYSIPNKKGGYESAIIAPFFGITSMVSHISEKDCFD